QTITRLDTLYNNGHFPEKIEIIVNGGTWSAHPIRYKTWFIKRIFDACNEFKPYSYEREDLITTGERKTLIARRLSEYNHDWFQENKLGGVEDNELMGLLEKAQAINEKGRWRIIGLTLETRPDYITLKELAHMRRLGCTKVELGVQTLYDDVQLLNNRGHDTSAVIRATKLLREAGFKIAYHMMPNLYGSTPERDIKMFEDLFNGPRFQPDHLKVYPCLVVKEAKLHKLFESGAYKPYSDEVMFETLLQCKLRVAPYCRISRLMRDIPSTSIKGGLDTTNIRQDLQKEVARRGLACRCIRCREARDETVGLDQAVLVRREYEAGDGQEIFLSYESRDEKKIYAFVRLRVPQYVLAPLAVPPEENVISVLPELADCAHIRELHTYGKLVPLTTDGDSAVQHMGFGKRLMKEAERVACEEFKVKRMAVIAGVGVREYYAKLGYKLEGTYMVKDLNQ
ncbi:tRNA uridine(34) 5-carboxymethylaminomethyl modification radical SAM/GNAT enzyme Elp3, partial [Candidatus Uhrbacteria bacterium]|nr:tRNA uridine(34) 5-carboxymethylaminomethyl modification radical SAM/GNAT enzyme Elp3 [Candidatus Uhrbacteria bacterium]